MLDYIQLRKAVGQPARGPYDSAAFKAMVVAAVEAAVVMAMAVTAFRARAADAAQGHRRRERVGLVVQVEQEPR